jgi:hypothetical protein
VIVHPLCILLLPAVQAKGTRCKNLRSLFARFAGLGDLRDLIEAKQDSLVHHFEELQERYLMHCNPLGQGGQATAGPSGGTPRFHHPLPAAYAVSGHARAETGMHADVSEGGSGVAANASGAGGAALLGSIGAASKSQRLADVGDVLASATQVRRQLSPVYKLTVCALQQ